MKSIFYRILIVSAATAGAASAVTTLNLSASPGPNSGTVNGAFFTTSSSGPAGSGVFNPFIRLQNPGNNNTSAGFNSSLRPVMSDANDPFTKDLKLGELDIVQNGGLGYYLFRLDINEPAGGNKSTLSIDTIQLYTSSTSLTDASSLASLQAGATIRYNLDGLTDSEILLDYNLGGGGSGKDDMWAYIPTSLFSGLSATDYLYFYTEFGHTNSEDAGFEEWAGKRGTSTTPTPTGVPGVPDGGTTLVLLGGSLLGLGSIRRMMLKKS